MSDPKFSDIEAECRKWAVYNDNCMSFSQYWMRAMLVEIDRLRAETTRLQTVEFELALLTGVQDRLNEANATIARTWDALGIDCYEDAGGREISEIVAELKRNSEREPSLGDATPIDEEWADAVRGDELFLFRDTVLGKWVLNHKVFEGWLHAYVVTRGQVTAILRAVKGGEW